MGKHERKDRRFLRQGDRDRPDLSKFRLYFTSIARVNATYNALGPAGSSAFEETLAANFPSSTAADFAPLRALIVDEDTYVQQGLFWKDAHWAYLEHILGDLGVEPISCWLGRRSRTSSPTSSWGSTRPRTWMATRIRTSTTSPTTTSRMGGSRSARGTSIGL